MKQPYNHQQSIKSLNKTIKKMAPAILTALISTALGFLALYSSPVPMIQDFGKMLTIGMVISFIIAILVMLPILFIRDSFFYSRKKTVKVKETSKVESILYMFTKKLIRMKWMILIIAFITASLGLWADQHVDIETDIETFMPQNTKELKEIKVLRETLGSTDQISIVYSSEELLSETNLTWVNEMTRNLQEEFPNEVVKTKSITTLLTQMTGNEAVSYAQASPLLGQLPQNQVRMLVNEDHTQGVINVSIKHLETKDLERFIQNLTVYLDETKPGTIDITVTGKAVIDVEMISALTTGRYTITIMGMLAVFIGLLMIYRNPIKAITPIFPILLIVGWSGGFMYLLGLSYTPLTATLGALIIGIGTEFTILIMERFEEEKEHNDSVDEAISSSVSKIGKAILASGLTTIGGFSALIISDFQILSNFGIMTLINITLALLSTLIVMPVILSIQNHIRFRKH